MLRSLILVSALCTDICAASFAYGANRVHMDWGEVVLLDGIYSGCLGLALELGSVINSILPGNMIRIICFVSLFLLGFIKFLDHSIRAYTNRHCCIRRNLSFSLSGLRVIINVYRGPMAADADGSQSPRWKEAVFLALAMSIDSLAAGIMATLLNTPMATTLALSFVVGVRMIYGGLWLGCKVASCFQCDLSWISGVLLTALTLMKILL